MTTRRNQDSGRTVAKTLQLALAVMSLSALGMISSVGDARASEVQKLSSRVAKSATKSNGLAKFTAVVNTSALSIDLVAELQAGNCAVSVENATASFSGSWPLENCSGDASRLTCARSTAGASFRMKLYKKIPGVYRQRFVVRGVADTETGVAPLDGDMTVTMSCNSTAVWTDTLVNCNSSRGDQVRKCSGS